MKVWMVFVQGDDATWLEEAWDDESTAANHEGWQQAVTKVREMALHKHYEVRIIAANVPGVFEAFEIPEVEAAPS